MMDGRRSGGRPTTRVGRAMWPPGTRRALHMDETKELGHHISEYLFQKHSKLHVLSVSSKFALQFFLDQSLMKTFNQVETRRIV